MSLVREVKVEAELMVEKNVVEKDVVEVKVNRRERIAVESA